MQSRLGSRWNESWGSELMYFALVDVAWLQDQAKRVETELRELKERFSQHAAQLAWGPRTKLRALALPAQTVLLLFLKGLVHGSCNLSSSRARISAFKQKAEP